jgi:hypothetical protein
MPRQRASVSATFVLVIVTSLLLWAGLIYTLVAVTAALS